MSAKREKRRRMADKYHYYGSLSCWVWCRPPKLMFWRYRKWKRDRPVKPNWMH